MTEEQRQAHLAKRRAQYAADPAEREKRKAAARKWSKENPERKREYNRKWEEANPERAKLNKRRWFEANADRARQAARDAYLIEREDRIARQRERKTGFSAELFEQTLEAQGHCCAICKDDLRGKPSRLIHADHCHDRSKPRGILCNGCNSGIGFFRDDPDRLRAAIEYLQSHAEG